MKKTLTILLASCTLFVGSNALANNPLDSFITAKNNKQECLPLGAACNSDFDCCSGWCAYNSNGSPKYVCTNYHKEYGKVKFFEGKASTR